MQRFLPSRNNSSNDRGLVPSPTAGSSIPSTTAGSSIPSTVIVVQEKNQNRRSSKSVKSSSSRSTTEKGDSSNKQQHHSSMLRLLTSAAKKYKKYSSSNKQSSLISEPMEPDILHYTAPEQLHSSATFDDLVEPVQNCYTLPGECVVCLESFQIVASETVKLKTCHHMFHFECIDESLKHERRCPVCRTRTGRLQGKCPSGSMVVSSIGQACPGFEPATTIKIQYTIPSGVQESYHPNPDKPFHGTSRTAYLPNTLEGRQVLARLKYAWKHGLTFTIGTSLTTRREDSVVWSSIHHKTSIDGGAHSWPDSSYMANCNTELNAFGIPDANTCLSEILQIPTEVCMRQILTDAIPYRAPTTLRNHTTESVVEKVTDKTKTRGECSVCLNRLQVPQIPRPAVRIKNCSHVFHKDCLQAHLKKDRRCPRCRLQVKEPQGKGPSGDMLIEPITTPCPGFEPATTIQITYTIPSGMQCGYHENPGVAYEATTRIAYLPDNEIGQKLLLRLKYAWMHGLSFSVGTSLTTGRRNSVVWSSVFHKTSLNGGQFGFPDAGFVFNCNDSLDALGVPDAESLMSVNSDSSSNNNNTTSKRPKKKK